MTTHQNKPEPFRFVYLTDTHIGLGEPSIEQTRRCIRRINALDPPASFVINGGDLVKNAYEQTYEAADADYRLAGQILGELNIPVYHSIGNHDLFGVAPATGVSTDHPEYGKAMFRQRIGGGRTYFSFDFGGWHFILLDSIHVDEQLNWGGGVDAEQIDWLKKDLEILNGQRPICLVTHIAIVSPVVQIRLGAMRAPGPGGLVVNGAEIYLLCEPHRLKLVLQAHTHFYEEAILNGTRFIGGGAVVGGWGPGPLDGPPTGFGLITVNGGTAVYEHIDVPE